MTKKTFWIKLDVIYLSKQKRMSTSNEWDILDEEETDQEGASGIRFTPDEIRKARANNEYYKKRMQNIWLWFVVALWVFYLALITNRFYSLNAQETSLDADQRQFLQSYVDNKNTLLGRLWLETQAPATLTYDLAKVDADYIWQKLEEYISDENISYLTKKDQITTFTQSLNTTVTADKKAVDQISLNITKFAFLPEEIDEIISDNEIQRWIVAIESIKLFTALKVFSLFDSVVNELSQNLWLTAQWVNVLLKKYASRGESDMQRYLLACFLNPLEDNDCKQFGDFDRYYAYNESENSKTDAEKFYPRTFARIVSLFESKLENSVIPLLTIMLNKFDTKTWNISFAIEVNTSLEDKNSLFAKGELNPHIFIVSQMVNLIRESLFVVWKWISIDTLKVTKKKIREANNEFVVDNSNYTFDVPIQKTAQREIFDYVYGN